MKKSKRYDTRFTEEQSNYIIENSKVLNISPSEFIRQKVLSGWETENIKLTKITTHVFNIQNQLITLNNNGVDYNLLKPVFEECDKLWQCL